MCPQCVTFNSEATKKKQKKQSHAVAKSEKY